MDPSPLGLEMVAEITNGEVNFTSRLLTFGPIGGGKTTFLPNLFSAQYMYPIHPTFETIIVHSANMLCCLDYNE